MIGQLIVVQPSAPFVEVSSYPNHDVVISYRFPHHVIDTACFVNGALRPGDVAKHELDMSRRLCVKEWQPRPVRPQTPPHMQTSRSAATLPVLKERRSNITMNGVLCFAVAVIFGNIGRWTAWTPAQLTVAQWQTMPLLAVPWPLLLVAALAISESIPPLIDSSQNLLAGNIVKGIKAGAPEHACI
jgi:hypothetical protein